MSVAECITKLVQAGTIPRDIADEALALYERSRGEFIRNMGPAQAEAAAGLAAARAMDTAAKRARNDVAKQALGFANFERVMLEHADGPIAGVMDQLSASLRGRGTRNVDTLREDIWARLSSMFGDSMEKFSPGLLGTSRAQIASARNLIYEIFGHSTGDNTAAAAGQSWAKIVEYADGRAQAAGRRFEANENWRVPQLWQSDQVRKVKEAEFVADFTESVNSGGIKQLWETREGRPARADETEFILRRAYADITGSGGGTGAFSPEMRTFEFAPGEPGAAAWLKLQDKYGVGDGVFAMLTGHMQRAATEIALAEVIAPNHRAVIAAVLPRLRAEEAKLSTLARFNPTRLFESPSMVERTYDVITGRANSVDGHVLAGVMGGIRSINTAAQLKGAVISAVPGDSVTTALAGSYNGMPATRIIAGVARELGRGGDESRALAARLNLTAHAAMEYGHGYRFFSDQIAGPRQLKWLATTMIRAQGLSAWTDMMKRVFSMEFTGHLADHAGHTLAELGSVNKPLANFLRRHSIDAAEWDTIRATPAMDVQGAKFLDTAAMADQALAEKLRGAIIQERRYAVLEPDARIRAITTGGLPQGTFMGEMSRSLFLFKSFSLTMAATHITRTFTAETWGEMARLGLPFVLMHFVAGAAAMQAKNIVYGRDPEKMDDAKFWVKAFAQGGGLGLYGDLLNSGFSRTGRSFVAEMAGPVAGVAEDALRLTTKQVRKGFEGSDTTLLAELTRVGKRYTPGTFYTKLATDRLLWDQIQTMVDPDYRGSFRRMEQRMREDTGQRFWFRPGQVAPDRAPDASQIFPTMQ